MKKVIPLFLFILLFNLSCGERPMKLIEGQTPEILNELISGISNLSGIEAQNAYVAEWTEKYADTLFPLVTETENGYQITFLYYEESESLNEKVTVGLDINEFDPDSIHLVQADNSNLFYGTVLLSDVAGIEYCYYIYEDKDSSGRCRKDPFNRNIAYDKVVRSVIELPQSENGYIQVLEDIVPASEITNLSKRDIYVYLPPDYYSDTDRNYPVIYMQDGQNIWDSSKCNWGGWKMDTLVSALITEGSIEPVIIVGIRNASANRSYEYVGYSTYYGMDEPGEDFSVEANTRMSLAYEDFVVNQIKPLIDNSYRTLTDRENTAIGGSSYGAGVSLFIAFRNSDTFSKVAALSGGNRDCDHPNYLSGPFTVYPYLIDNVIKADSDLKIYMDCGTLDLDADFLIETRKMHEALNALDFTDDDNLYYYEAENQGHNEGAWAKRVPTFMEYLFGISED